MALSTHKRVIQPPKPTGEPIFAGEQAVSAQQLCGSVWLLTRSRRRPSSTTSPTWPRDAAVDSGLPQQWFSGFDEAELDVSPMAQAHGLSRGSADFGGQPYEIDAARFQ